MEARVIECRRSSLLDSEPCLSCRNSSHVDLKRCRLRSDHTGYSRKGSCICCSSTTRFRCNLRRCGIRRRTYCADRCGRGSSHYPHGRSEHSFQKCISRSARSPGQSHRPACTSCRRKFFRLSNQCLTNKRREFGRTQRRNFR